MRCPVCGHGKARRECPGLGKTICAVCCGTKRLVEIACPETCGYLAAAREHPPAVVKRQQERDVTALMPSIRHLTERQYQLFFLVHTRIARHTPEGFARLLDADVAEAAAALAATLETSARGVIYEHSPASLVAQRLLGELKQLLAEINEQGATVSDHEAGVVLRAIEQGARAAQQAPNAPDTAYLSLVGRLLQLPARAEGGPAPSGSHSSLILP